MVSIVECFVVLDDDNGVDAAVEKKSEFLGVCARTYFHRITFQDFLNMSFLLIHMTRIWSSMF